MSKKKDTCSMSYKWNLQIALMTSILSVSALEKALSKNNIKDMKLYLNKGLAVIKKHKAIYQVLGKHFFEPILRKNNLLKF